MSYVEGRFASFQRLAGKVPTCGGTMAEAQETLDCGGKELGERASLVELTNQILRLIREKDRHDAYDALDLAQMILVKKIGWVNLSEQSS